MTILKGSLLLPLALLVAMPWASAQSASTKTKWVKFDGTSEQTGDTYHLRAKDGGELDVPKDAVNVDGTQVKLKVGAIVKVTKEPENKDEKKKSKKLAGCRQTQCVGLVLICCDDGHVISACIGAWGCS